MKDDVLYKSQITGAIMRESEWLEAWEDIRPSLRPDIDEYFATLEKVSENDK